MEGGIWCGVGSLIPERGTLWSSRWQQYTSHGAAIRKNCLEDLERRIRISDRINSGADTNMRALGKFLHEKTNGVLIRIQISTIKEINTPTRFLF